MSIPCSHSSSTARFAAAPAQDRAPVLTRRGVVSLLAAPFLVPVLCGPALALDAPSGPTILTISGKIRVFNRGDASAPSAVFDRAMLEALGTVSFETATPWYDKPMRFEGVPMSRLLETVQAYGDRVVATALNDYATEIPISDFAAFGTILAMKRDGTPLSVRDKGPLFIIYPFDSNPELRQQRYYGRSAWQLAQLAVK